jgi:hypothetical protein
MLLKLCRAVDEPGPAFGRCAAIPMKGIQLYHSVLQREMKPRIFSKISCCSSDPAMKRGL